MNELNLRECVIELKKGNFDIFDSFYETVKNQVFYNILALTKSYDLAEDLLQETFVSFLKNIEKVNEDKSILGYLITISRNLTMDYFRSHSRLREIDEINDDLSSHDESTVDRDLLLDQIEKILKEKEFEIFTLHVLSELTFEEISKIIHKPLGTVLWSYNNSIKKLQKELKV